MSIHENGRGLAPEKAGRTRSVLRGKRKYRAAERIILMVLCLFLLFVPAALAETEGSAGTADSTVTDTAAAGGADVANAESADGAASGAEADNTGTAGADPAAAVAGDTGERGSIELLMKYKDQDTNKEVELNSGALSIYDVTELRDWTQWTTQKLEDENSTLASSMLNNELKNVQPLATQKITAGKVKFENLPRGMYLICQSELSDGERMILPFLMSIPDKDGQINISAAPKPGFEGPKEKPNDTPTGKLPQTGLVLWPVFMLIAGGLLLILIGTWLRRSKKVKRVVKASAEHNRE